MIVKTATWWAAVANSCDHSASEPRHGHPLINVDVEHGHSGVTMTFPPVDLRPHGEVVLSDDWSLPVAASRTDPVVATWTATASNADGPPATGRFTIDFTGPDVDIL